MGHSRLGKVPTTKAWRAVIGTYAGADPGSGGSNFAREVGRIATKAMAASADAVRAARSDGGVAQVFFLLTQLALATHRSNMVEALEALGIRLPLTASPLDLTVEVHRVLDEHLLDGGHRSDVGEMAQLALGEALAGYLRSQPRDMFSDATGQRRRDLHGLGTQKGFGEVAHEFCSGFGSRLLGFQLSRIVRTGEGQSLIGGVGDLSRFNAELRQHSRQRAMVVRDFATKWFTKTEFEQGIDPANAKRFTAYALKKLEDSFKRGAEGE